MDVTNRARCYNRVPLLFFFRKADEVKSTYTVTVEIDDAIIELESKRLGRPFSEAAESLIADCECRLSDAVRWRDGVQRVGVRVLAERPTLALVK